MLFSTCALKFLERNVASLVLTLRTASLIPSTNSGWSTLAFGPYTCIKHREPTNNFNLNMHTLPPSGVDSSTQLASWGLTRIPRPRPLIEKMPRTPRVYCLTSSTSSWSFPASSAVAAQLWPPKMLTGARLMVIYKKKFLTLCYISRPNGLQNKISELQKQFWQNQALNQVLRFGGAKYIFIGDRFLFLSYV